jgi:DnaJ domain
MTELVLRRGGGYDWAIPLISLRAYQIIVDGRKVGTINRNSETRIPVAVGKHTVQLKIDFYIDRVRGYPPEGSSPELVLSVAAGSATVLECGPKLEPRLVPYMPTNTNSVIWLDVADRGRAGTSSRSSREEKGPYSRQNEEEGAGSARLTPAAWHKTLRVPPDSSMDDIRRAYHHRISEYHPDKVAQLGDEIRLLADQKSKEINAAYEEASRQRQGR